MAEGGWIPKPGARVFNQYSPPTVVPGDATEATKWVDHVRKVYPDDADHIINWVAHRVQFPGVKLNHAPVLGGNHGVGRDTILEPVKHAVGPWNFQEVNPQQVLG